MREHITQLAASLNRPWRFGGAMAADTSREGKLLEELAKPFFVLSLLRINLGIASFQIDGCQKSGRAMTRASKEDHVQVVLFDLAREVRKDKRKAGTGSPMT